MMLTIATAFSGLPAIFFMIKEYREWKLKKHNDKLKNLLETQE